MYRHRFDVGRHLLAALSSIVLACGSPQPAPPATSSTPSTPPAASREDEEKPASTAAVDAGAEPAKAPNDDPAIALADAKKAGKATFIVFCAKWVAACGELANAVADSSVQKILAERFVVARVDATNEDDPATTERMKRYNVKGLPSMIVFDRKGKEVARENGYVDAGRLTKMLERVK